MPFMGYYEVTLRLAMRDLGLIGSETHCPVSESIPGTMQNSLKRGLGKYWTSAYKRTGRLSNLIERCMKGTNRPATRQVSWHAEGLA